MPSYIAKTHEDWASFLKAEGITDSVNFWSPNPTPLLKALPGNRLFLFPKCPPDGKKGWSVTGKSESISQLLWKRLGEGSL
jgi:hypothetical protein